MGQCDMILDYMKDNGGITQAEAIELFGCYRLASRICDIKGRGIEVCRTMVEGTNRFGAKVRYAKYWLKKI